VSLPVTDVQRSGKAVLHLVQYDGIGELVALYSSKKKIPVKCNVDVIRRLLLMRHHTATHIINGAAREILGRHVWQAGAHKSAEGARLDITHFEQVDDETLARIEARANEMVMEDRPVSKSVEERSKAERENGFRIYQGGFIPDKDLRIVGIPGFDVEACGGTHCDRTGEVGLIKILGAKRIQDGIVRLEFVAGERALRKIGEKEMLIKKIAMAINAPEASLLVAVRTMVEERRHLEKRLVEASKKEAEDIFSKMIEGVRVSGETMVLFSTNEHDPEIVEEISRIVSGKQGILSVLNPKGVTKVYVARGRGVPLSAREILRSVCEVAGGGGGGTDDFARGEVRETKRLREAVEKALKVSFG
jgi:alanyl-tRNA synthetase